MKQDRKKLLVDNGHHPREGQLTLSNYQERACASNQFQDKDTAIDQLRFGLYGEIGTILALVKKSHRDLQPADLNAINEELGDALWYLTVAAVEYGSGLQEVGIGAIEELQRYFDVNREVSVEPLTFNEFDGLIAYCRIKLHEELRPLKLRQLGIHCGQLLIANTEDDLATTLTLQLLSTILADMLLVGALFEQRFKSIAEKNIGKIESRWPPKGTLHIPLFDEGYSADEKFPREFCIHFIENKTLAGKPYVIQKMNKVNIGDRLTDNRATLDGYRFHDVFHLAYIVHLGWSPVIRALLKIKRKSNSDIDENEDGARAIIIEEAISTWIFNHAHRRDYFSNIKVGRLDYNMLKQVADMVDGYEVARCPLWQWEKAILDGFEVFRQLRDAGSGIIEINLGARTLTFKSLNQTSDHEPPYIMQEQDQPAT